MESTTAKKARHASIVFVRGRPSRGLRIGTRARLSVAGMALLLWGRVQLGRASSDRIGSAKRQGKACPASGVVAAQEETAQKGIRLPTPGEGRSKQDDDDVRRQCLIACLFGVAVPLMITCVMQLAKS